MRGAKRESADPSTTRPLLTAASFVGAAFLVSSVSAFFSPAAQRHLAEINLVILFLAFFVYRYALSLVASKQREIIRLAKEREALVEEARRMAEESDRVGRSIMANMTHEFRTPLNSVIGFAELLEEGETDASRIEMARFVQQGGWELLALVNSLVKTAELSNSAPTPQPPKPFTLGELAGTVGAAHQREIQSKGLLFKTTISGTRRLVGDLESIAAVLGILVSNAVKHSEAGTIELKLRELNVVDGGRASIEIVVSDQGRGIEKEALDRLFHPFERRGDPLLKRSPGAGVGLHTAKRLTDALRGDLRVESEAGTGTTAYLIIPLETERSGV